MKITRKVIKEIEITEDLLCNLCGNSLRVFLFDSNEDEDEDTLFDYSGLIGIDYQGNYWSNSPIEDMVNYSFNLCESCLGNLFASFKIPAEQWDKTTGSSRYQIQEALNKIYNQKDPSKLTEDMLDENSTVRRFSELRYKQLKNEK